MIICDIVTIQFYFFGAGSTFNNDILQRMFFTWSAMPPLRVSAEAYISAAVKSPLKKEEKKNDRRFCDIIMTFTIFEFR